MSYILRVLKTLEGLDTEVEFEIKNTAGLLMAIAHVTAEKDIEAEKTQGKDNDMIYGASIKDVSDAYQKLSYDKRLMVNDKLSDETIIRIVFLMVMNGDVCFVNDNPFDGIRLTGAGMVVAITMFKELQPMKTSAVYEFIKRGEVLQNNISNN